MVIFDVDRLSTDPHEAIRSIFRVFAENSNTINNEEYTRVRKRALRYLYEAIGRSKLSPDSMISFSKHVDVYDPTVDLEGSEFLELFEEFVEEIDAKDHFDKTRVKSGDLVAIPNTEKVKILNYLNAVQNEITNMPDISTEKRDQLLDLVHQLIREFINEQTPFERSLDKIRELGAALGDAGEKSKPFVNRITETLDSVSRVLEAFNPIKNRLSQSEETPQLPQQ